MNILVVDDREDNRYLIEILLKGHGHAVRTAVNGADALEMLRSGGTDMIISDILMPVMDGFQFCRAVKADPELRAIPFIIHTATYTGPQDEEFALSIGADGFIIKPCEPDAFIAALDGIKNAARSRAGTEPPRLKEEEVLKLYSERLIRKLEQKMVQAEEEIVARRAAEKDLRQSEERLIAAQRIARMGDFVWDPESGETAWSQALYDLFGYDPGEIFDYARIDSQIYHPEDRQRIRRWIHACTTSAGGELPSIEYRAFCKNGQILIVRTAGVAQPRPGRKPLIFATVQDITERKRNEEERARLQTQLLHAQKMESVGRMAGGIAHDYHNMLAVITGYAELALDRTSPGEPVYDYLNEIQKAAKRSTGITRQLLAFARKQSINPVVLDLNKTVGGMLEMIRRLIGEEIELNWLPGDGLWRVKMDPSQTDQILANLCVNARDAIDGIGRIVIGTQNVRLTADDCAGKAGLSPGEYVMLGVSDNGCGMNKETLEIIFEPFFTTKDIGKGTGLGLSTIYGIVKQNEGFIDVTSEPGRGTDFRIYLPRHAGEAIVFKAPKVAEAPAGRGETILIVEDEAALLDISRMMLEGLGYRLLSAATPGEALTIAEERPGQIQLLITDVVMPEMNGRDLADRLQSKHPGLKVLFMSGYTANVMADRGVVQEGMHFIQKPFSRRELALKVEAALGVGDAATRAAKAP